MRVALLVAFAACGGRSGARLAAPADCALVAELFASHRLGNYAAPEERAPIVADVRAACVRAAVTADEQACIARAKDELSAELCVPRMFPQVASHDDGDCQKVVDKIRAAMPPLDRSLQDWADEEFAIEVRACIEDGWPDTVKKCMLERAANECTFPAALQAKLQQRIDVAFKARFKR